MTHVRVQIFLNGAEAHSLTVVDGAVVATFSCPLGDDRDQRGDIAELAARAWDAGMAIRRASPPRESEHERSNHIPLIIRTSEDRRTYLKSRARRIMVPSDIALPIHEVIPLVHAVFPVQLVHADRGSLPSEPGTCIGLLRDKDVRARADWVDWIVPADTRLTCPRCIDVELAGPAPNFVYE